MNQTPELIFRKMNFVAAKYMKTFSFLENSISGKWNIFWKCFYTNQQPLSQIGQGAEWHKEEYVRTNDQSFPVTLDLGS